MHVSVPHSKCSAASPFRFFAKSAAWLLVVLLLVSNVPADDETESGDGKQAADAPVGASDEGELAMGSFRKPEGWEVALFAAEPELGNPVALYVDNTGRVFICESFRQDRGVTDNRKHDNDWLVADLSAESVQDRIDYHKRLLGTEAAEYTAHDDRIRLLQDTDGDGVADTASVFADGFNKLEEGTGAGVLARGNDVYFTCIPKLWLLTDSDGNGQADAREALHDGYGVRVAFRGHDSHGLIIGPDGRLYFSIGDRGYNITTDDGTLKNVESGAVFRCELDGSKLEVFATGLRNPQELAFDDYGYLFTGDNNSDSGDKARWVNVMQGGDTGWRMMYQYIPDRGPFNREKIWHPYNPATPGYIVPPIENIGDGPSGLSCYPGTGLSGDFENCFFMVDFRGGASNSGIRLIRTQPKGAFWEVERSEELIWNILATDADFGPDGALWVCDWVNGWVGEGKGRIYRFFDTDAQQQAIVKEVQSLLAAGFSDLPAERLYELLRHVDRRIRLESQWELAGRGDLDGFTDLVQDTSAGTLARLHAVWGLGHAARIKPQLREPAAVALGLALGDRDLDVRAAAAGVVGDLWLKQFSPQIVALISDSQPRVQYAACLAAGKLKLADAVEPACQMLQQSDGRDPGLRHAGIMALTGGLPERIVELKGHESAEVRLAAVVALRKLENVRVAEFLADTDPAVQLEAARAIHDVVELHAQLPALAAVSLLESPQNALVHRVLNANFRLGGQAAASRLGAYAAAADSDPLMRIEALQMLATWAEPGQLDRVMNRFLPLEPRDALVAREALALALEQVLTAEPEVSLAAVEAATALRLESAGERMQALAVDMTEAATLRGRALNAFVSLSGKQALPVVATLINDPEWEVRTAALTQLAKLDPDAALPQLEKAVQSEYSQERQLAWDTLATLKRPEVTRLLSLGAERYIGGRLPKDVWLNFTQAAEGKLSDELTQQLADFQETMAASDPLAAYRDCLEGGDVEAGKVLFTTKTELSCVRCHKVGGTGGEVGPDLSKIAATKDRRYLLESIVLPDAKIAENFETIILLTEDGDVVSGILRSETDTQIELIDANGVILSVDPEIVVGRKKGKSSMPADLVKLLSPRELRDLIAYLATLRGE